MLESGEFVCLLDVDRPKIDEHGLYNYSMTAGTVGDGRVSYILWQLS
jgi:hypothetical protein